jgi:hypothetical protein
MYPPPPRLLPWRVGLASSAVVGSLAQPLRLRLTFHGAGATSDHRGPSLTICRCGNRGYGAPLCVESEVLRNGRTLGAVINVSLPSMEPHEWTPKMFATLVHADWSVHPSKRWIALARRRAGGWTVLSLSGVDPSHEYLAWLFAAAVEGPVLAGFDFPIGLPSFFGAHIGQTNFRAALGAFGGGRWSRFYDVAGEPGEIALERPFYPRHADRGTRQVDLLHAHGVTTINDLRRRCEVRTPVRLAACPLFWTLGPNQVGKAAIRGWQEILAPAVAGGAGLWPFDGDLHVLAKTHRLVIAETYPAEAYHHLNIGFARHESKRRVKDRASRASAIFAWASAYRVSFRPPIHQWIDSGCGSDRLGEDRFDALVGLLAMIEVAEGRRSDGAPDDAAVRRWEGWILGQTTKGAGPALDKAPHPEGPKAARHSQRRAAL